MRDVNNGWFLRYAHGAPCDGVFEQTNKVGLNICPLLIRPTCLINGNVGKQSVNTLDVPCGKGNNELGGALYGQANELDTSNWSEYKLVIQCRFSRLLPLLSLRVRATRGKTNRRGGVHI